MSKHLKINVKSALGIAVGACLLILTFYAQATGSNGRSFAAFLAGNDTIPSLKKADSGRIGPLRNDPPIQNDTSKRRGDSMVAKVDSIQMSSDSLETVMKSHAEDSGVLVVDKNQFYLYGKAKTEYKDLSLEQ
jgi:LPS-assembly protein